MFRARCRSVVLYGFGTALISLGTFIGEAVVKNSVDEMRRNLRSKNIVPLVLEKVRLAVVWKDRRRLGGLGARVKFIHIVVTAELQEVAL